MLMITDLNKNLSMQKKISQTFRGLKDFFFIEEYHNRNKNAG